MLHYEDILAPIHRDEVMRRLKIYLPGYEKGATGAFSITRESLSVATQRAQALSGRFDARSVPEPFTAIVDLVELLVNLRTTK